jgi:hypothetical protein
VAWIAIVMVSINLLGYFIRGFFLPRLPVDGGSDRVTALLQGEAKKFYLAHHVGTLIAFILTVAFLFALYHYWNVGLALSAGIIMLARMPDLLWEIRNGRKMTLDDKPTGLFYQLSFAVILLTLPLVWYSLCRWPY